MFRLRHDERRGRMYPVVVSRETMLAQLGMVFEGLVGFLGRRTKDGLSRTVSQASRVHA